jgi:DNA-binding MarR family transcriptional regulator
VRQHDERPITASALDRVARGLRPAEWAVQARKDQRLRPLGLAAGQYPLLIRIQGDPGPAGAELARRPKLPPQAVASQMARLEERGQLERRPHPRHRHRQVQELHLTDAGRDSLHDAGAVIVEIQQQIAEKLGAMKTAQLRTQLGEVADVVREA